MALISTSRLDLVPMTPALIHAALRGETALAAELGAELPPDWPPEHYEPAALEYTLARLGEGAEHAGWWMYFFVRRGDTGPPVVVGTGGYKGPPDESGTVEIGYSVAAGEQRRGYATEAVRGLVARAFADERVRRVIAETYPALVASVGVLEKTGFHFIGDGSEPGVVRYELPRPVTTPPT